MKRPFRQRQLEPAVEIGGHDGQRNLQRRKIRRHRVGQELEAEFFRVHQRRLAEGAGEKLRQRAGARLHQPPPDLAGIVGERDYIMADILAAHAGRIGGADQRADRGAGDGDGFDPHLVEGLDHRDVRKPARPAAAERKREGFHRHTLSLREEWAAAGAVLLMRSRLWPRLPAPRPGLLHEDPGQDYAPVLTANSQAFAASGRTSVALAAATALVAVPSRTRPTMPCRIAAMRKKL